jgi:adenine-specific DNA-methyltransferase
MIKEAKKYQAFYTKSTPIVDYMVNKLLLMPTDKVFEPCGGDGVFIEAILDANEFANIDICELNPTSIAVLQHKFSSFQNVSIRECDTLLDNDLSFNSNFGGYYDKIIANPPYGAWQDLEKRAILKKMYSDLYAKESYALFLFRCIELLKEDGILSFIIPDTFLNLHMHKAIRKHILTKTKIVELALFPSSFQLLLYKR